MSHLKRLIVEIHHRSIWQVLLIYVGAGWFCFEIIDSISERFALPVWLPAVSAILFLIGLPFVVATVRAGERGVELLPDSVVGPAPRPPALSGPAGRVRPTIVALGTGTPTTLTTEG